MKDNFNITITHVTSGNKVYISATAGHTILQIKQKIEGALNDKNGFPPSDQVLKLGNTLLDDDTKTCAYYGINKNETLSFRRKTSQELGMEKQIAFKVEIEGKNFELKCSLKDTVSSISKKFVGYDCVVLQFNGEVLEASKTLHECGIQNGSMLIGVPKKLEKAYKEPEVKRDEPKEITLNVNIEIGARIEEGNKVTFKPGGTLGDLKKKILLLPHFQQNKDRIIDKVAYKKSWLTDDAAVLTFVDGDIIVIQYKEITTYTQQSLPWAPPLIAGALTSLTCYLGATYTRHLTNLSPKISIPTSIGIGLVAGYLVFSLQGNDVEDANQKL